MIKKLKIDDDTYKNNNVKIFVIAMNSKPWKNKETIEFVENIKFSENIQPKAEIKEEEGFDQEVWKSLPLDVKPKLEQKEGSETGQVKIKTEPREWPIVRFSHSVIQIVWSCKKSTIGRLPKLIPIV